jgi:hypothetical protein
VTMHKMPPKGEPQLTPMVRDAYNKATTRALVCLLDDGEIESQTDWTQSANYQPMVEAYIASIWFPEDV